MSARLLICAVLVSPFVFAAEPDTQPPSLADNPDNYCHDPKVDAEWSRMLAETPADPIVIKLYALRAGLCGMVDKKLVNLDEAARIWELERVESAVQRFKEDNKKRPKTNL